MKFDPEVNPILDAIAAKEDPDSTREYAFEKALEFYKKNKFFEAHEIFEFQWKKEFGVQKLYLQALIQISVSMNKVFVNVNLVGAESQAKLAREKLLKVLNSPISKEATEYIKNILESLDEWIDWIQKKESLNSKKPEIISLEKILVLI
ncbi:MAG TPA: DUF309 domain-containing protein [Leptospiraceae bacterium]|nr:DUF309 domain-containing protein [Leptospiraceae bacterium]HMW06688.1 DUF309 domain-containing protein [Leptospiraceae bacterium]HMX31938.1 DUF309 domain-containing protein [Leptospiraceae bacterium]HMY33609.1 DUF309 domain-containing protein [Leptospiraceae bacterium]HMZ64916.1 DUF309 domain-containing protein [Leptospiraceae bacterium]